MCSDTNIAVTAADVVPVVTGSSHGWKQAAALADPCVCDLQMPSLLELMCCGSGTAAYVIKQDVASSVVQTLASAAHKGRHAAVGEVMSRTKHC